MLRRYTATVPPRRRARLVAPTARLVPAPAPADDFNAPLHSLKAFAIATAIVLATASASVAGVMAYLDVHDTAQFGAHMRARVSQFMPSLTAKIYRVEHDPAQQRLADAFDKGGFDAWAEAAASELEAELDVDRARR